MGSSGDNRRSRVYNWMSSRDNRGSRGDNRRSKETIGGAR